ncbi:hypothetical protein ACWIE7_16550 [Dietzia sp. NPDC055343]
MVQHNAEGPAPAIAVALDLDLDAAEPPRVRSAFEPGELSVAGDDLWIGDRFRPILQNRSGSRPEQSEDHLLPLPVGSHSDTVTPHAGPGGLWIERQHKLWSVEASAGAPARLHDLGTVRWGSAVTIGNHLVTSGNPLRRFTAHGEDDPIALPPEIGSVGPSPARTGDWWWWEENQEMTTTTTSAPANTGSETTSHCAIDWHCIELADGR